MKNNLILSGLHLNLTDSLKGIVYEKMEKIFKHEERIIRARIELEHDSKSSSHENEYVAKGHLELKGKPLPSPYSVKIFIKPWMIWLKNSIADSVGVPVFVA